jgi:hypothetical protein
MRTAIIQIILLCFLTAAGVSYAADLAPYEKTCAELGFKRKTPAFGDCVLELLDRSKTQHRGAVLEEQRRNEEEARRRSAEQVARGDGTPEHGMCVRYGFTAGTTSYAECRQKIDIAKREERYRQQEYEERQRDYQERLAEYKKERERRQGDALMRFGAALAGGTSPNAIENFGNAGRASLGIAPQAPQMAAPQQRTFTITNPNGRMTTCNYMGNNINCF